MAEAANHPRSVDRASRWALVLAVALGLRVLAAFAVTWYAEAKGKPCVFADTLIYRELARAIAAGEPYRVEQWGTPHFALRTPGYPLFLAACRALFGPGLLAARLVQAILGTLAVWLVARLARSVLASASPLPPGEGPGVRGAARPGSVEEGSPVDHPTGHDPHPGPVPEGEGGGGEDHPTVPGPLPGGEGGGWGRPPAWIALAAAGIAAVDPYVVAMSALVLSEATFVPLMMLGLWGLATLWRPEPPRRSGWVALGTGLAMGLAILSRPSWALFLPLILAAWVVGSGRGMRRRALTGALVVALATAAVMAPWWVRNARVIGKFVPTALWVGASLYDGIGPQANGESDMAFLEDPDVRSLGEAEQDAVFLDRSMASARAHPGRVVELALVKFARFWSPWPNAGTLRGPGVAPASALATLPVLALIAVGAWDRRRDFRALAILAGPLAYFCVLHMAFVSSIRYRIPGEVPAMALAGLGLARALAWARPRDPGGSKGRGDSAMTFRRRLRKALGWGAFLVVAILVGGTIAAYHYVTESDTLADLIRREAPKYLPGCRVNVLRVRFRPLWGDVVLNTVQVQEPGPGPAAPLVASAYRVSARFDPWAMLKGRVDVREVTIGKPKIRLRRRLDGSWNVQGLLADPWPIKGGGPIPPVTIQEGVVELSGEGDGAAVTLLRDVTITIPGSPSPSGPIKFDLTAKGDAGLFDRLHASGSVDPTTGRVDLDGGELIRLSLSEAYHDRLPAPVRDRLAAAGLAGGEVDVDPLRLSFDPSGTPRFRYQATAKLRRGLWKCPKLPFPVSDVAINLEVKDGELAILQAHGSDGSTGLGLTGRATLDPIDPARSRFRVVAEATNLELDSRLRGWIPPKERELWDSYFPGVAGTPSTPSTSAGRVSIKAVVARESAGAEVAVDVAVECLDVSLKYKHFAYPIDHVKGIIRGNKQKLSLVGIHTMVNDRPVRVNGTVLNPGPDAVAALSFEVESLPLNDALYEALPPEVKPVYKSFHPSGSVRGKANLKRLPPLSKADDPRGRVSFDAWAELNPGCSATWDGLRYPVLNLQGRLEIHPDLWVIPEIRGNNGQAAITLSGQVEQTNKGKPKVGPDAFKVDLNVKAANLPFDQQLRDSLPPAWRMSWETLNPSGASDIDAEIHVAPGKPQPDRDRYRIVVVPREGTGVKLRFKPLVGVGAPPVGPVELPMDAVAGTFVYDTAEQPHTSMTGVRFSFQRAPVTFAEGKVDVRDNGQFALAVGRLEVAGLRLDEDLRKYMPPVMAQFSRRLDDVRINKIMADLELGWSGHAGESAWCRWRDAKVLLIRNRVSIGTDIGLENIQGELKEVRGSFNGRDLEVHGKLDLASVDVFEQQVTELTADVEVEGGLAGLEKLHGRVLGGVVDGHVRATLAASPDYSIRLALNHADLQDYALSQPGHQGFRGLVDARIDLAGTGYDPHAITGDGWARIIKGDLGTLPVALRFVNALRSASLSKKEMRTAFDSAEVAFRVHNGETTLRPVRLVGNAFTLAGEGTLDVGGEIDVRLHILPGRDSLQIPVISDLTRGLSGQILVVRVHGPLASPNIKPEPIPLPGDLAKNYLRKREIKKTGLVGPWRTGLESRFKGGIIGRWSTPDEGR